MIYRQVIFLWPLECFKRCKYFHRPNHRCLPVVVSSRKNEHQLAVIIGHELSHALLSHSVLFIETIISGSIEIVIWLISRQKSFHIFKSLISLVNCTEQNQIYRSSIFIIRYLRCIWLVGISTDGLDRVRNIFTLACSCAFFSCWWIVIWWLESSNHSWHLHDDYHILES